jgi:hypothetical protein
MESLYMRASVVVLPSHVEGFGLGLVHSLAARKVVVARDIPATREILSTYQQVSGVFLYRDDTAIVSALKLAMNEHASQVNDDGAESWDDWVDGFAKFCLKLLTQDDLFERIVRRMQAGDMLRKSDMFERLRTTSPALQSLTPQDASPVADSAKASTITDANGRRWLPAEHVKELLHLDGEELVNRTYVTLFKRLPDTDGLVNYLTELQAGISKLEIVSRLRKSTEGRKYAHPLTGYRSIVMRTRMRSLLGLPDE